MTMLMEDGKSRLLSLEMEEERSGVKSEELDKIRNWKPNSDFGDDYNEFSKERE